MKRWLWSTSVGAFLIGAFALPAAAQRVPVMSTEEVQAMLPDGSTLEKRLDGDINGDGQTDTVFIARGENERKLFALLAYRSEVELGRQPVGELKMNPYPLGEAALSIRKGVLIVEDLTGGTTATQATYRYRFDPEREKMRLIGLDAERYSRTNRHGSFKLSWNLLDGTQIVERGEPNSSGQGDEALIYARPERSLHKVGPIWMEDTPDPDALIDEQIAAEGEDRD